uniref:Uncharacterized protein n=1 Tax=Coccidioides posadasii RMSCC 3488 TaxID=454284 RepID=A0A0J6FAJ7_COCPO|nr:hypothetical protein CPAG_02310 [Coccidioides posadasii RMSCC 3488]
MKPAARYPVGQWDSVRKAALRGRFSEREKPWDSRQRLAAAGTRSLCRRKFEAGIVPRQWRERVQSLIDFAADIRGTVLRYLRDDKKETVAKPPKRIVCGIEQGLSGTCSLGFGCKARDGLPFLVQHSSQEGKQRGMKAIPRAKGQFCVHNL